MDKLIILGDIGLVRDDFNKPLMLSEDLKKKLSSTITIANLEAAVTNTNLDKDLDIMQFVQSSESLKSTSFINAFSLANNHINDLGFNGIDETKKILSSMGYSYFGLKSRPFFEKSNYRVIGAATYLNIDISCPEKDAPVLTSDGGFWADLESWLDTPANMVNIIYLHIGTIFNAFPSHVHLETIKRLANNPKIDFIVTSHSHCIGGFLPVDGAKTCFNLGDFFLNGIGNRRGRSIGLQVDQKKKSKLLFLKKNNDSVTYAKGLSFILIWLKTQWFFAGSKLIIGINFSLYYLFSAREFLSHFTSIGFGLFKKYGFRKSLNILWVRRAEVANSLSWLLPKNINKNDDIAATAKNRKKITMKDLD